MKGIAGCLVGAIVLALLGSVAVAAGTFDRRVARAQQEFAAQRYQRADAALAALERYVEYGSWIPWVGSRPLNEVRTRRAAMRYWSGQYDRIAADLRGSSEPIDLQLIAANGVYRRGQANARDRRATLEALQDATIAYLEVLKNAPRNEPATAVAAYNYEYVVRTRDDIDKGRRGPELTDTAEDGPAGRKGGPPPQAPNKQDLKMLIPLEPGEMDKGIEPGKGTAIQRKG